MNWQMWLLVLLLVFILVSIATLAWMVWLQNRRIATQEAYFQKVLHGQDSMIKTLEAGLRVHSERVIGTTEHLRM